MFSGKQILPLIFWILICFIPAVVGSRFMPGEWYARLAKPSWTPPGYLFGPVWTFLYATMGISAWLLWKKVGFSGTKIAFALDILRIAQARPGFYRVVFFVDYDTGHPDRFLETLSTLRNYPYSLSGLGIFRGCFKLFNMVSKQTQLIYTN
jgi:tryptophan-rich sensory protein